MYRMWWLSSLVAKALDLQLAGCEFNSQPWRCRVTTLDKLFTPTCLSRSQWFSDGMIDCGVRGRGQYMFITTATVMYSLGHGLIAASPMTLSDLQGHALDTRLYR